MQTNSVKKLFLSSGIAVFLVGCLMRISHINYGIETLIVGILIFGFGFVLPFLTPGKDNRTIHLPVSNYPNMLQSFGITGLVILGMLLLSPVSLILNDLIGKEASMLGYYLLAIGIPFGIAYSIRTDKTKMKSFNLTWGSKRIISVIAICSISLLFGIASPIGSLIPMPESMKEAFMAFGGRTGIFAFILMVIAAPVLEELIFRGIILDGLLRIYSPVKSILVSSFLFGFVHLNPWQFVTGLVIGIFSGWVYYKTRSLLPSIVVHAAANLSGFGMRLLFDADSSMDKSLVEMYGGWTNLIVVILGSLVVVLLSISYLNREFTKAAIKNGSVQQQHTGKSDFDASLVSNE
jgi:membrane protease YdiL (CAAX protease family)